MSSMLPSLLVFAIFVAAAILMFLRRLPALLALPLMAVAIGLAEVLIGNLDIESISLVIVADGAVRLYEPMVISMFGGILSFLMQKSGVAESIVRRGAELAGDDPWMVSVLMLAIVALLFTTIGGLGAVIMVGTIILPILSSNGLREQVSAGILLFGISLGGILNANNWAVYRSVLGLADAQVASYALSVFAATAAGALIFVSVELLRSRTIDVRKLRGSLGRALLFMGAGATLVLAATHLLGEWLPGVMRWSFILLMVWAVSGSVRDHLRRSENEGEPKPRWFGYLIPVVPLLLILLFGLPFISAFFCGVIYGAIVTLRKNSVHLLSRSAIEGSASVIPAIVLMIGIGMLLSAILGPTSTGPGKNWHQESVAANGAVPGQPVAARQWPVTEDMKPLLKLLVPASGIQYVLIFSLFAPLALYRGPLNVWGLGYGVGGILMATGVPAAAVMGALMSLGIVQGVSDPTNTQNVWVANEVRVGVTELMWRTLPYAWGVAVAGLIAAALGSYS